MRIVGVIVGWMIGAGVGTMAYSGLASDDMKAENPFAGVVVGGLIGAVAGYKLAK